MRCFLLFLVVLAMFSAFGDKVVQPETIPGKWAPAAANQFPPLEKVIADKGAGSKIYGLYSWAGEYMRLRNYIKAVGWKQCRIAGPWSDKIMKAACEDGIEVMPTLGIYLSGKSKKRPDFKSDDDFIKNMIKSTEEFLKRYGPNGSFFIDYPKVPKLPITHVEIWNEPNFQYMIPPDSKPRLAVETEREKLYAKLLTELYKKIKPRWPEVKIVAFAAGGENCGDIRFIEHVHDVSPDVAKSYDVLSTHPYVGSAPPEAFSIRAWGRYSMPENLAKIRATMQKHHRTAPVWYTEVGWPVSQKDGGRFKDRHIERIVPLMLQAAYIVRTYALALRMGVQRVNVMFIVDSDGFNGGFFTRNGKWRPSAYAVKNMIKIMPNPRLTGSLSDGEGGLCAYVFDPDAEKSTQSKVIMVWNVTGPKKVVIPCKGSVKIFDMSGNLVERKKVDGQLNLEIGPYPIYIVQNPESP